MATKPKKLEVILPIATAKKSVIRFQTEEPGVAVSNVYISLDGMRQLDNPSALKITVEAHEAGS